MAAAAAGAATPALDEWDAATSMSPDTTPDDGTDATAARGESAEEAEDGGGGGGAAGATGRSGGRAKVAAAPALTCCC